MSDIALGMIIGGVIGVVGSAAAALIHGHYSLKGKREDNSARQREQATKIQHEKDSQFISRLIARRSTYLEPLSTHLNALYSSISHYERNLVEIVTPYYRDRKSDEIQVPGVNKQEFLRQLTTATTEYEAIATSHHKVWDASSPAGDPILIQTLTALTSATTTFYNVHIEMNRSFCDSATGQDWVYDFKKIIKSIEDLQFSISIVHKRIEQLFAGVE